MGEKILTMGVSFFVSILVARYLGPEGFGILSYAISMVTLVGVAGHMGLGGLVVRELVKTPEEKSEILGTAFVLKLSGFMVGFVLLFLYLMIYESSKNEEFWILMIISVSLFFKPFSVIEFWFESRVQAKYSAMAHSFALLFVSFFKVVLVYIGAELLFFAFANVIEALLAGAFLVFFFCYSSDLKILSWRFSFSKAKELLSQGWVIYLGAFFGMVYLKIDQVMLKWFIGAGEVGVYAVAAKLSEIWYFVPVAIVASFFPKLIELKKEDPNKYSYRLQQIFEILFLMALSLALVMTFISKLLISLFFGQKYLASAPILAIHIWAGLFIFMRAGFSKWILIENVLVFSLITQGSGALMNVLCNYLLIPKYGGHGAAIATLISYAAASYLSLLFYKKTRPVFWMMTKAMFCPVRYPLIFLRRKY
jgi:O-antigen/teichoic acid export membrane protein